MESHPLADLFPMMGDEEFSRFATDIASHGQREAIVLLDGKILDGRNRFKACRKWGMVAETCEFNGDDPLGFVLSKNLHRRHLTESQRAMVAAQLATFKVGQNQYTSSPADLPVCRAAALVNVSDRSVRSAKAIIDAGDLELIQAVRNGQVRVHRACRLAKLGAIERRKHLRGLAVSTPGPKCKIAGKAFGDISWSELDRYIRVAEHELLVLRRIRDHAANRDLTGTVSDALGSRLPTIVSAV
jgi:hypothetical protein